MSEWFVERRGFANGVRFTGSSAGGLILPLVLPYVISSYGSSKALRILGIAIATLLDAFRTKTSWVSHWRHIDKEKRLVKEYRILDLDQLRTHSKDSATSHPCYGCRVSKVHPINITFQGLTFYSKAFASALNLSSANAAIALSMLNGASAVGRLILGHLSDKLNPWLLALSTLVSTSLSTFILWGILSINFTGLLAFGIVHGALAGGWSCVWAGFVRPLASDDPTLVTTLLGYLMLSRGIGNIFSTPISSALLSGGLESNSTSVSYHSPRTGFQVDNGKYGKMIFYVGACYAGAAASSNLVTSCNLAFLSLTQPITLTRAAPAKHDPAYKIIFSYLPLSTEKPVGPGDGMLVLMFEWLDKAEDMGVDRMFPIPLESPKYPNIKTAPSAG
ncbi:hypothetical protein AAF712_003811 [Marasmius tenuissimus]|uniref:Uncharacterized protein n=1 Tax=Marasmius tenuissimus TaxID=585030 RepID=A0ABR3A6J2_9AGAR